MFESLIDRLKNGKVTPSDEFLIFFLLFSLGLLFIYIVFHLKNFKYKFFKIKRKSKFENRYSPKMGRLVAKVTTIKLYFLNIPIKTYHKFRETYYGEIKDVKDCDLKK